MSATQTPRIGFCCKWINDPSEVNGVNPKSPDRNLNTMATTVAWLNRQDTHVAEQRLWDIMVHNIQSVLLLVERVGSLEPRLRMVRLSSDLLPVYTEPTWSYFWRKPDVRDYCERHLAEVGARARSLNVRLSFHPGQFCVLASTSPDIVRRSIEEFEYHADLARWMGYGQKFQDFKINVHISGREGPEGIRRVLPLLSTEARNCITIENEEMSHGLDDCLSISDVVPIVLDIHHHWVREGEYIMANDARVQKVIDSWRGVRPVLHYSVSREDVLSGHDPMVLPVHSVLLTEGKKKSKLRAHSDFYWNRAVNAWALSFNDKFDIQCESKGKNLASFELARSIVQSQF